MKFKWFCNKCERGDNYIVYDVRGVPNCRSCKSYDIGRTQKETKKEAGLLEEGAGVYNPDDPFLQRLDVAMENLEKKREIMNWKCNHCERKFEVANAGAFGAPMCPYCESYQAGRLQQNFVNKHIELVKQKKEKENDMKKVYEFVVYNQEGILWEGKVLAKDEDRARLLIPDEPASGSRINFADDDIEIRIRPFC